MVLQLRVMGSLQECYLGEDGSNEDTPLQNAACKKPFIIPGVLGAKEEEISTR